MTKNSATRTAMDRLCTRQEAQTKTQTLDFRKLVVLCPKPRWKPSWPHMCWWRGAFPGPVGGQCRRCSPGLTSKSKRMELQRPRRVQHKKKGRAFDLQNQMYRVQGESNPATRLQRNCIWHLVGIVTIQIELVEGCSTNRQRQD